MWNPFEPHRLHDLYSNPGQGTPSNNVASSGSQVLRDPHLASQDDYTLNAIIPRNPYPSHEPASARPQFVVSHEDASLYEHVPAADRMMLHELQPESRGYRSNPIQAPIHAQRQVQVHAQRPVQVQAQRQVQLQADTRNQSEELNRIIKSISPRLQGDNKKLLRLLAAYPGRWISYQQIADRLDTNPHGVATKIGRIENSIDGVGMLLERRAIGLLGDDEVRLRLLS